MFKVGDYVMINRNAYSSYYAPELDDLFFKVARIINVKRFEKTGAMYYILDITKHCNFKFAFSERFLISLKEGI